MGRESLCTWVSFILRDRAAHVLAPVSTAQMKVYDPSLHSGPRLRKEGKSGKLLIVVDV